MEIGPGCKSTTFSIAFLVHERPTHNLLKYGATTTFMAPKANRVGGGGGEGKKERERERKVDTGIAHYKTQEPHITRTLH